MKNLKMVRLKSAILMERKTRKTRGIRRWKKGSAKVVECNIKEAHEE